MATGVAADIHGGFLDECSPSPLRLKKILLNTEKVSSLHIDKIRTDGGTQARASLQPAVVRRYAGLIADDLVFPPLRVWFDGSHYWLSDGFHRLAAAALAGFKYVTVEVFSGSQQDAIWDSFNANSRHGLAFKHSDLALVIERALKHQRAASLSNVEIARYIGTTEATIRRSRHRLSSTSDEDAARVVTRNGKAYKLRIRNIGGHSRDRSYRTASANQLHDDLAAMTRTASSEAAHLLEIIHGWLFDGADPRGSLAKIEELLRRT